MASLRTREREPEPKGGEGGEPRLWIPALRTARSGGNDSGRRSGLSGWHNSIFGDTRPPCFAAANDV